MFVSPFIPHVYVQCIKHYFIHFQYSKHKFTILNEHRDLQIQTCSVGHNYTLLDAECSIITLFVKILQSHRAYCGDKIEIININIYWF